MAQYKTYWYDNPDTDYRKYIPDYQKYEVARPNEQYSDARSPYASQINEAQNRLNTTERQRPGAYTSTYNDRINALIDNMADRKFNYDINGDALYNQYKDQYMRQGKQAMQDSMAQAAALTGGYGSSYSAAVGNQAYQSYLDQLNDRIPELYQLALSRYNTETADKQNLYNMMSGQEAQNYSQYRDRVADYQADRGYYDAQLQNLRTMGQNLWGQNWDNYWNAADRTASNWSTALNAGLDAYKQNWDNYHWANEQTQHNYEQAVAEDQWAAELAEQQRQHNENLAYNYYNANRSNDLAREKMNASGTEPKSSNSNTVSESALKIAHSIKQSGVPKSYALELLKQEYEDRGNITAYEYEELQKLFK